MAGDVDRRSVLSGAAVVGGVAAATLLSGTTRATAALAQDPGGIRSSLTYVLSVDGVPTALFPVLLELTLEVRAPDGAVTGAGRTSTTVVPPTVRLRRPLSSDLVLSTWHERVRTGQATARRACTLEVVDHEGTVAARYDLVDAWPSRLETAVSGGPDPVLTETVTLTAERITRVS